jgi:hypothetical protein
MERIFRRVKRSVIKYYFLSLQELAFTIRCNIVPIGKNELLFLVVGYEEYI